MDMAMAVPAKILRKFAIFCTGRLILITNSSAELQNRQASQRDRLHDEHGTDDDQRDVDR